MKPNTTILYLLAALAFCIYMASQPSYIDSNNLPVMYSSAELECKRGNQVSCVDKAQIMMCINGDKTQCPVVPDSVAGDIWAFFALITGGILAATISWRLLRGILSKATEGYAQIDSLPRSEEASVSEDERGKAIAGIFFILVIAVPLFILLTMNNT